MPLVYSFFGIWMYSNRQIYGNEVKPKVHANHPGDKSHTIKYTLTTFTPGTPLMFLLVASTVYNLCAYFRLQLPDLLFGKKSTIHASKLNKLMCTNFDNFYYYISLNK